MFELFSPEVIAKNLFFESDMNLESYQEEEHSKGMNLWWTGINFLQTTPKYLDTKSCLLYRTTFPSLSHSIILLIHPFTGRKYSLNISIIFDKKKLSWCFNIRRKFMEVLSVRWLVLWYIKHVPLLTLQIIPKVIQTERIHIEKSSLHSELCIRDMRVLRLASAKMRNILLLQQITYLMCLIDNDK